MKPLYDKQLEMALLGSMILDPSQAHKIPITGDMFYLDEHKWICQAIIELPVDQVDVLTITKQVKRYGKTLPQDVLLAIVNSTPTSLHIERYFREVREYWRRRQTLNIANKLASSSYTPTENMDEIVSAVITELSQLACGEKKTRPIAEPAGELLDEIYNRMKEPREYYGIPTGLIDFDKVTSGLQKGEILILAGDPGVGKSMLAMQLCVGMQKSEPGAIYELEMSEMAVLRRTLSTISKISANKLKTGKINEFEWEQVEAAIQQLEQMRIFISDSTGWTTAELRADLARLKSSYNIGWFMLDYMALIKDPSEDQNVKSLKISQELHSIVRDLNLAGLLIHSINKEGMAGNARKEHLSGSGGIVFDADQICFLTQTDKPNVYQLRWDKMRDSETPNAVKLVRMPGFPCFECYAPEIPNHA